MRRNIKHGAVLFTFDDCDIDGWTKSIEFFRQYHAHATFSFCGEIGEEQISCMKALAAAGHSIGLHTIHHEDAPMFIRQHGAAAYWNQEIAPQYEAVRSAGLTVRNFAFPNNRYDEKSLQSLQPVFQRFRTGCGASLERPEEKAYTRAFFPVCELAEKITFGGFGVGEYYKTRLESLLSALDRAARNNMAMVVFSHSILPQATGVHMPLEYLTEALEKTDYLGMAILGFDDLDDL